MKKFFSLKYFDQLALFFILVVALLLRLYKISFPLADHHSWRQVDSAAVIRNLTKTNFNLFFPQWNNLVPSNSQNLPNPNRYFFEDFPPAFDIYAAAFYQIFGGKVEALRLTSIIFSFLTIVFLYLLVKEFAGKRVGLLAALVLAILPYSVFFSRGLFQEIPLNFYAVSSFYFLSRFLKGRKKGFFFLAIVLNALLFLTKPYALVFLLPEAFLFFSKEKFSFWKNKDVWLFFLLSLLPFVAWWLWVRRFPEGIPYSDWLFNEGNIRFKGSFFYWIFAQRLSALILGFYGILFFGLGLLVLDKFSDGVFYAWLISLLVYVSVIAKGNVTHDYYQIPFLPVVAYFSAKGIDFLLNLPKKLWQKMASIAIIGFFGVFAIAFSWYQIRDFYNLQSGVDLAGDFVNQNTPEEALIIAGDGADPTLLYNTNRIGWTVGFGSIYENKEEVIENLREKGASYYVTTAVKQIAGTPFEKYLRSHFSVVKETDQFIVFSLSQKF